MAQPRCSVSYRLCNTKSKSQYSESSVILRVLRLVFQTAMLLCKLLSSTLRRLLLATASDSVRRAPRHLRLSRLSEKERYEDPTSTFKANAECRFALPSAAFVHPFQPLESYQSQKAGTVFGHRQSSCSGLRLACDDHRNCSSEMLKTQCCTWHSEINAVSHRVVRCSIKWH